MQSPETALENELTEEELRQWDWRSELRRQERSVPWLARQTNRADQTVYQYASGSTRPSLAWLAKVAEILDWKGPETE
jgi:hypothetical protein